MENFTNVPNMIEANVEAHQVSGHVNMYTSVQLNDQSFQAANKLYGCHNLKGAREGELQTPQPEVVSHA